VTGRPIAKEIRLRRIGDPAYAVADARRANELLGWRPAYKNLREIIAHAWRWMSLAEKCAETQNKKPRARSVRSA